MPPGGFGPGMPPGAFVPGMPPGGVSFGMPARGFGPGIPARGFPAFPPGVIPQPGGQGPPGGLGNPYVFVDMGPNSMTINSISAEVVTQGGATHGTDATTTASTAGTLLHLLPCRYMYCRSSIFSEQLYLANLAIWKKSLN